MSPDARVGIGLGLVILLAGCSSQSPQPKATSVMTPAESVTALYGFYAKTVDHLGADGWAAVPADATVEGVTPDECRLVDGKTGVQYSDVLVGPGAQDPAVAAAGVRSYWKSLGEGVREARPTVAPDGKATADAGNAKLNAQYIVDTKSAAISLVTACVPGDYTKLTEHVIDHRASSSPFPTPAG